MDPRFVASGLLAITVAGSTGRVAYVPPESARIVATQEALGSQTADRIPVIPTVELIPAGRSQKTMPDNYETASAWYKSKRWWKRNAPIIGGAAGGGLIGGLAGGGTGAVIGGAVGGGGGYLYKHMKERKYHRSAQYRSSKSTPKQPEGGR
jgi:Glycine zipper